MLKAIPKEQKNAVQREDIIEKGATTLAGFLFKRFPQSVYPTIPEIRPLYKIEAYPIKLKDFKIN